ncbi:MAG: hypothetical protein WBA52_16980 [Dolichospermum sp.]
MGDVEDVRSLLGMWEVRSLFGDVGSAIAFWECERCDLFTLVIAF